MNADGELRPLEITGPSSFETWQASWRVLQNSLLMLDAVDLGVMTQYHDKIQEYHRMYQLDKTWLLLYQTDVRARLERANNILDELTDLATDASTRGDPLPAGFDPSRPWNKVYTDLLKDRDFWHDEFTQNATAVLQLLNAISEFISLRDSRQGHSMHKT